MKVVAINGSPNPNGNTAQALQVLGKTLEESNITLEIIHVGNKPLQGCIGCATCARTKDEECIFKGDGVNEAIQRCKEADGIVIASPVYFAGMSGTLKCFLDRMFYVSTMNQNLFKHKIGASLCVLRRSGGVETFNALNNYITYSQMIVATSHYWNVVHGARSGEVQQDEEGIQIVETLAKEIAYLVKMKNESTVEVPLQVKKVRTNFIR